MRHRMQVAAGGIVTTVLGLLLTGVFGCGYRLAGQADSLPKDVRSIYIEPFLNRSRAVGLEKELTTALRGEFYRRGQLKVVDRLDEADAILTGVIRGLESHVASVNTKDEVLQYEAVLRIEATLRRRQPSEILWQSGDTRLGEVFAGSRAAVVTTSSQFRTGTLDTIDVRRLTDIQLTEAEFQGTRDRLIERFARDIRQRLMEGF